MLKATTVKNENELLQVLALNQKYLKEKLSELEQDEQGFLSWSYTLDLLKKLHSLAPSIIIKDEERVVGYALTTLMQARLFHNDLKKMFQDLVPLQYNGKPLFEYRFYFMGQICIDKNYRGRGLVKQLYKKHKEIFSDQYDFILTEVATKNYRSIAAHKQAGFQTIFTYNNAGDEWNVVIWDWS